jgi:hypothetical protein
MSEPDGTALDRLAGPGADLLARVDAALLAHGLPTGHPIVGLLRRLGALPGDASRAISAQRPAVLRAAGSELRKTIEGYERQRDLFGTPADWSGSAGAAFAEHRAALVGFLAGDTGGADMAGRLRATAEYLDEVAEWMEDSRAGLARALAEVLGSVEAIRLRGAGPAGGDGTPGAAAATIGARILAVAAEAHDAGRAVAERWAGRLDEVPYRPPAVAVSTVDETRLSF